MYAAIALSWIPCDSDPCIALDDCSFTLCSDFALLLPGLMSHQTCLLFLSFSLIFLFAKKPEKARKTPYFAFQILDFRAFIPTMNKIPNNCKEHK
jgi:hypothetical protein